MWAGKIESELEAFSLSFHICHNRWQWRAHLQALLLIYFWVCVGGCVCVREMHMHFFKMYLRHLSRDLTDKNNLGEWGEKERGGRETQGQRERERVTVSQMKKDSIRNRVLIVSKQGRCVGPGEEEGGGQWCEAKSGSTLMGVNGWEWKRQGHKEREFQCH